MGRCTAIGSGFSRCALASGHEGTHATEAARREGYIAGLEKAMEIARGSLTGRTQSNLRAEIARAKGLPVSGAGAVGDGDG